MSETTRVVIVNAEEFGLRESADFLEQHSDECDPAYLAAVAASMRQAADSLSAHAQAVQRLTEELKLVESAMSKLSAQVAKSDEFLEREGYRRCDISACNCGSWHRAWLRPRPEGST